MKDFHNYIFPDADLQSLSIDLFAQQTIMTTRINTALTTNNPIFQNFCREEQA